MPRRLGTCGVNSLASRYVDCAGFRRNLSHECPLKQYNLHSAMRRSWLRKSAGAGAFLGFRSVHKARKGDGGKETKSLVDACLATQSGRFSIDIQNSGPQSRTSHKVGAGHGTAACRRPRVLCGPLDRCRVGANCAALAESAPTKGSLHTARPGPAAASP